MLGLAAQRATQRLITMFPYSLRMKIKSALLDTLGVTQLQHEVRVAKEEVLAARMELRRVRGLVRLHEFDRPEDQKSGDRDS